jgi:hypothetical protein
MAGSLERRVLTAMANNRHLFGFVPLLVLKVMLTMLILVALFVRVTETANKSSTPGWKTNQLDQI